MFDPVKVDDTDKSRIVYEGHWNLVGHSEDYQETLHETEVANATATFTFNGTSESVQVFGTFPPSTPPTSIYTLDGGPPVAFTAPNITSREFQQQFYGSPPLSADVPHTLIIQSTDNGPLFLLDYIQYTPNPSASFATTAPILTPTASAQLSISPSSVSGSKHVGAIAGGVVGGLEFLGIFAGLLIFIIRRRRYHSTMESNSLGILENDGRIIPFVAPSPTIIPSQAIFGKSHVPMDSSSHMSVSSTFMLSPLAISNVGAWSGSGVRKSNLRSTLKPVASSRSHVPASQTFNTFQFPSSEATPSTLSPIVREPLVHRDGGISLEGGTNGQQVELPPAYGDQRQDPEH